MVLSDDPDSSKRIAEFSNNTQPWMVAVRMVSEGVDVPRLAVGVYATSASTPLYFAQAVGRFVRARKPGETASVFLPSVPVLLDLAAQLELQRDHVIGKPHREKDGLDDELLIDANKQKDEPGEDEKPFVALAADAELDQVIYEGSSFGTATIAGSAEEADYLGIPGLLDADQMRALLRDRQSRQIAERGESSTPTLARRSPARRSESRRPTGSASCAASSTVSSLCTITAPTNRTASSMASCAANVVARQQLWLQRISWSSASRRCGGSSAGCHATTEFCPTAAFRSG